MRLLAVMRPMKLSRTAKDKPRCRLPSPRRMATSDVGGSARDDARWQAVVVRDKSFDAAFVYAVSTTGIYCRPGCPSRRADRRNVTFHDTAAAAERAGFRPCKRCLPNQAGSGAELAEKIVKVCRVIELAETPPPLQALASMTGLSRFHFHRVFKEATGVTPKAYGLAHRAAKIKERLVNTTTITDAIYDAGYSSSGRFYADSTARLGMTPRSYKSGGAGTALKVAVAQCSLGALLVAASVKGVAAILLGDDPDVLLRDVQDRFPKAQFTGGDAAFEKLVQQVIALIERPGATHRLPLDVQGTAFQQQVWKALTAIRPGTTASYQDIARQIGKPSAVRAVAGACAANALAVAIPCHRVVRTDGNLSGYRWGIERKRELLSREENSSRRKL